MLKFLSPTVHGYIDYLAAIALIVAPFFVIPAEAPAIATWLSIAAGSALIIYSLITDYSVSARRAIPFPVHLAIDFIAGVIFLITPFVLDFSVITELYYWVMGSAIILVVFFTNATSAELEE